MGVLIHTGADLRLQLSDAVVEQIAAPPKAASEAFSPPRTDPPLPPLGHLLPRIGTERVLAFGAFSLARAPSLSVRRPEHADSPSLRGVPEPSRGIYGGVSFTGTFGGSFRLSAGLDGIDIPGGGFSVGWIGR